MIKLTQKKINWPCSNRYFRIVNNICYDKEIFYLHIIDLIKIWKFRKILHITSILNPQPRVYEEKLQEIYKTYIRSRSIKDPHITGGNCQMNQL